MLPEQPQRGPGGNAIEPPLRPYTSAFMRGLVRGALEAPGDLIDLLLGARTANAPATREEIVPSDQVAPMVPVEQLLPSLARGGNLGQQVAGFAGEVFSPDPLDLLRMAGGAAAILAKIDELGLYHGTPHRWDQDLLNKAKHIPKSILPMGEIYELEGRWIVRWDDPRYGKRIKEFPDKKRAEHFFETGEMPQMPIPMKGQRVKITQNKKDYPGQFEEWTERKTGEQITNKTTIGYHYGPDRDKFVGKVTSFYKNPSENVRNGYLVEIPAGTRIEFFGDDEFRVDLSLPGIGLWKIKYKD